VVPVEHYKKIADSANPPSPFPNLKLTHSTPVYYNPHTPTSTGDRDSLTQPYAIADLLSQLALHHMSDAESARFDVLEAAGFKLDRYGSLIHQVYNTGGGHYIDVGTSAKIASGLVINPFITNSMLFVCTAYLMALRELDDVRLIRESIG
jgi:hypothetical protein